MIFSVGNICFQGMLLMIGVSTHKHCKIKRGTRMATSSFTKTFILNAEAVRKVQSVQKQAGIKVPSSASDRVKEGKEALARFSSPSKK